MNVPIWIITGLQQRDRQDSQTLNNDTCRRLPVVSAQVSLERKIPRRFDIIELRC